MKDGKSVIYKYKLPAKTIVRLDLPVAHKVLHVGLQLGEMFAWVLHPVPGHLVPMRSRNFYIVGTGHMLNDDDLENWTFAGTVHTNPDIWHIFMDYRAGD